MSWKSSSGFFTWKRVGVAFALVAIGIAAFFGGCSAINRSLGLSDDHFIEEKAEDHIEDALEDMLGPWFDIDLDLTPDSHAT